MTNIYSKLRIFIATVVAVMGPALIAYAVVQTLNGQAGQTQTFANDTNITISSASDVHTLGWSGALSVSRGGTVTTTWSTGSIPFFDGARFTEDNSLSWDTANNRLKVGNSLIVESATTSSDGPASYLNTNLIVGPFNPSGRSIWLLGDDDDHEFGSFGYRHVDGNVLAQMGYDAGIFRLAVNGHDVITINSASESVYIGSSSDEPPEGTLQLRTSETATLYIGSSENHEGGQQEGCLVMGDSDGSGVSYVTVNDGVLSATTTKPSNCQ